MELYQILIPTVWTLIILGCMWYVKTNKRFHVIPFGSTTKIEASPALSWSRTKSGAVIAGFVFLALMWLSFIIIALDIITFPPNSSGANFMVFVPAAASIIFFFSGYSSRLVNNYVEVSTSDFDSWIRNGYIEKRGESDYVDISGDKLMHAFDNKKWIK